jgi:hypothetical protein
LPHAVHLRESERYDDSWDKWEDWEAYRLDRSFESIRKFAERVLAGDPRALAVVNAWAEKDPAVAALLRSAGLVTE